MAGGGRREGVKFQHKDLLIWWFSKGGNQP